MRLWPAAALCTCSHGWLYKSGRLQLTLLTCYGVSRHAAFTLGTLSMATPACILPHLSALLQVGLCLVCLAVSIGLRVLHLEILRFYIILCTLPAAHQRSAAATLMQLCILHGGALIRLRGQANAPCSALMLAIASIGLCS